MAYLLCLDKVYKPDGVFIDDPKGVFILRWYTEVDKNGATLVGYQHKACVGYRLMTNNDGGHFQWTSNVQLISKVYLKAHTNLKWHILNSKDKKMVTTATLRSPDVGTMSERAKLFGTMSERFRSKTVSDRHCSDSETVGRSSLVKLKVLQSRAR